MSKRVLAVGNCGPDDAALAALLQRLGQVTIVQAHGMPDALAALQDTRFDLVLVNRLMDRDGSSGLAIIRAMRADATLSATPVMMITNFPEHQEIARQAGAVQGFGKRALDDQATLELLREYLG